MQAVEWMDMMCAICLRVRPVQVKPGLTRADQAANYGYVCARCVDVGQCQARLLRKGDAAAQQVLNAIRRDCNSRPERYR